MNLLHEKFFDYKGVDYCIKLHEDDTSYLFTVTDKNGQDIILNSGKDEFCVKHVLSKFNSDNTNILKDVIGIESMFKYFEGIITLTADQRDYSKNDR